MAWRRRARKWTRRQLIDRTCRVDRLGFGGGDGDEDGMGMDIMATMGGMPLVSVLMWMKSTLPTHPEDLVGGLLTQVHGPAK